MAYRQVGAGAKMKRQSMNVDPDAPYPMDLPRLGYAVIVNNVASEQPGSRADVTSLKTAYQTVGFDVKIYTDCNAKEMRKIKNFVMAEETHKDSNCFALTIICHGNDKGQLLDKDKRLSWVIELFVGELSDVETLIGKPKILVIQSCRGSLMTEGKVAPDRTLAEQERGTINMLPDKADTFLAYATVPGYRAHAGDDSGSIYLQTFSRYLQEEYMRRPLERILKMVRQHMIKKDQGGTGMKQCPQETNTLVYDVVFSEFHQPGSSQQSVRSREIEKEREMEKKMNEMERRMREIEKQEKLHKEASDEKEKELRELREKMEKMQVGKEESSSGEKGTPPKLPPRKAEKQSKAVNRSDKHGTPQKPTPAIGQASGTIRRPVTLQLISTHHVDLECWWSSTVMKRIGQVVVSGQRKVSDPLSLFMLTPQGGSWKEKMKSPCQHYGVCHLFVDVQGQDLLAVSCWECQDIKLVNLDTQQVNIAFSSEKMYVLYSMCHGELGKLFVKSRSDSVMELNTSSTTFSLIKVLNTGINREFGSMCYIPSQEPHIVVIYGYRVKAVSCSNNQVGWRVEGEVDGSKIDPRSLLYLPSHGVILVADGGNERILVLDPSDGSHLQTITPGLGDILELCLYNNEIFMQHAHHIASYFYVS